MDAVHPTHAARPVGCWAPKEETLAIEQTSGRQRINIHGAIDLETGRTRMIEVETVDALSTIKLLEAIEALYPMLALIYVFLDNARYHHAKLVQEWLARPSCRIKLHFVPAYCPHLNPIERLWGVMHKHVYQIKLQSMGIWPENLTFRWWSWQWRSHHQTRWRRFVTAASLQSRARTAILHHESVAESAHLQLWNEHFRLVQEFEHCPRCFARKFRRK